MVRTKMVAAAIGAAAVLGGTMATPASAATHACEGVSGDPIVSAACQAAIDAFCIVVPFHQYCHP